MCVSWTPVSLACQNYEVAGFQTQAAANPFLGYVHHPSYILNPPNAKVCMPEMNEQRTDNGYMFFFHPSTLPSPKRYDNYDTRQVIRITYIDGGGEIGGTWYAVMIIPLTRWLGRRTIQRKNALTIDSYPLA